MEEARRVGETERVQADEMERVQAEEMERARVVAAAERARLSLEGLSVGDGFGECFFYETFAESRAMMAERRMPAEAVWRVTDDTLMAISLVRTLERWGEVVERRLAEEFVRTYAPDRGYGGAMHGLLTGLGLTRGEDWKERAAALFDGQGSFGNGSAMRVAPLGAYFADDLARLVVEAGRSAVVTHSHAEATAGAIAVAMGAALAWRSGQRGGAWDGVRDGAEFLETIWRVLPESAVRDGVERAMGLRAGAFPQVAAVVLGNGSSVSCPDTVPFVLWSAATAMESYEDALWRTVSAGGDKDTTCAMVGGIVVLRTGLAGVPAEWRRRRESLAAWMG